MAPVTRSMTRHIRQRQNERLHEIVQEIRTGVCNFEIVSGREYKKYMVYAIFDYLCDIKDELHILKSNFATQVGRTLKNFIRDAARNPDSDDTFLEHCLYYQRELSDYINHT